MSEFSHIRKMRIVIQLIINQSEMLVQVKLWHTYMSITVASQGERVQNYIKRFRLENNIG